MRALQYGAVRGPIDLVDVPEPTPPPGGAVISVTATGICRSDWHAWQGHDPVPLPHIPGHEFAGVVAAVGAGVQRALLGRRVTVPFVCGCGDCGFCRDGDAQVCPYQTQPGFTGPGSFADQVAVHAADSNVVVLPDTIDDLTAAALGCRFATAFRAVTRHGRVGPEQWVAVFGCGGAGLSAVQIAVAVGARVIAVDVHTAALDLAGSVGAEAGLDVSGLDPSEVAAGIVEVTGGGAHVGIDCFGSPDTAVASVRSLRRRGRHVQVGLLLGTRSTPPLPMDAVIAGELEIYGSHGLAAADYPALLGMITEGRVDPSRLIGRVIDLTQAGEALVGMSDPANAAGITLAVPGRVHGGHHPGG